MIRVFAARAVVTVAVLAVSSSVWAQSPLPDLNVFDAQYGDPASSSHLQDVIPQNGRTARIGLRWRLWAN